MDKKLKLTSAVLTATLLVSSFSNLVNHYGSVVKAEEVKQINLKDIKLNKEDTEFFNKIITIKDHFYLEKNKIKIDINSSELKQKYSFTEKEINKLNKIIINKYIYENDKAITQERVHTSGGTLYISNSDFKDGVFVGLTSAASSGPAALAAALTTLSASLGGPAEVVLGEIMTVISGPSLVELCGRILWAVGTNQGIYIKPVFSYPPLEIGYW